MIGIGTPNSQSSAPFPSPIAASIGGHANPRCGGAGKAGPRSADRWSDSIDSYRFGFCRGGLPVVAGASSGTQVIALRSYLKPFAAFSASLVAFITR